MAHETLPGTSPDGGNSQGLAGGQDNGSPPASQNRP